LYTYHCHFIPVSSMACLYFASYSDFNCALWLIELFGPVDILIMLNATTKQGVLPHNLGGLLYIIVVWHLYFAFLWRLVG
jgi:hypothetical protein